MSLQVSNQTSTGRRTPQVYQGFGGNVPTGAAAPGGGGGGPAANGAGGNVAGSQTRTTKGGAGGKQSQIPVAIGGTAGGIEVGSPSVPPTAVVHPGSGGNNAPVVADVPPLAFVGKKQQQFSSQQQAQQRMLEQYMQQQQAEAAAKDNATGGQKATNGSNANGGGVQQQQPAVVEKNGTGTKKTDSESAKSSATTTNTEGAKVRDSPRSSGRTQKASDELPKASDQPAPKEKQQSSGGNKTPQKGTPGDSSLVAEKPLKGFDADGEEMESLLLEDWDLEELSKSSQQQGSAKSKLPKPSPTAMARVAPNKSTGKQTGDVKLETVVEQKPQPTVQEKSSPKATEAAAPGTPQSVGSELNIGRPLRSISGRRSTRPISDIKFTHHRKSSELNDSISSLNVTVGSDVYMDSLRTPGSATRKRKDMTPESTTEAVESPKRARLDFSGFLGMVATPVTMLKNRLSRVKLQSSTPRALAVEEEDASKVVTAEATTTTTTTVVAGDDAAKATSSSSNTMEVDEKDVTVATTEAKENKQEGEGSGGEPAKEEDDSNRQQSTSAVADANDEVEVKIVTDQPQKQWCSVM
ncbi:proteoglycan 4-like [Anopheles ziemanni]|uniref:proteoglycan 4-like n=1 Tax=Anopheles coustani TaxID=139045 RepID=UPI002658CA82|nr:proteoglycan 4-like [Anopheles coustani]XP_058169780.1 proteoglycan 4-like [Anopheles ziemanni]